MDDLSMDDLSVCDKTIDDEAFASVAFDGDDDDGDEYIVDDCSVSDADDYSVSLKDDDCSMTGDSFEYDDIEDQKEQLPTTPDPDDDNAYSRRSSTSSARSHYAARRCKSVDMMTERLMIHADEFYRNKKRTYTRKEYCRIIFSICLVLSIALLMALVSEKVKSDGPPEVPEAGINVGIVSYESTVAPVRPSVHESAAMVEVPFANQHNLMYDGLLLIKQKDEVESSSASSSTHAFDSYAKTLDPITELHFAPGEANTTKHIVLTTTRPDLAVSKQASVMMASDPGLVLSIGLEANGEVWLPDTTGQRVPLLGKFGAYHHLPEESIKRGIYGPGDRFVLTIDNNAISLFRNDHHELVGMWMNPTSTNTYSSYASLVSSSQPLYAQIWFKDPKSSMLVSAWNDNHL